MALRAESDHAEAYPASAKQLAHSCGVKVLKAFRDRDVECLHGSGGGLAQ